MQGLECSLLKVPPGSAQHPVLLDACPNPMSPKQEEVKLTTWLNHTECGIWSYEIKYLVPSKHEIQWHFNAECGPRIQGACVTAHKKFPIVPVHWYQFVSPLPQFLLLQENWMWGLILSLLPTKPISFPFHLCSFPRRKKDTAECKSLTTR